MGGEIDPVDSREKIAICALRSAAMAGVFFLKRTSSSNFFALDWIGLLFIPQSRFSDEFRS